MVKVTGACRCGGIGGEDIREGEQQHLFLLGAHPSSKANSNTRTPYYEVLKYLIGSDRCFGLWSLDILRGALAR